MLGGDRTELPGGKGANQAVAAARLGQEVAIVGRVGADAAGHRLWEGLRAEGVGVEHLREDPDAPSGVALIAVAPDGENTIIVSPGANGRVGPDDIEAASGLLADAAVTLVQLEIPEDAVRAAALAAGGTLVLNPAPGPRARRRSAGARRRPRAQPRRARSSWPARAIPPTRPAGWPGRARSS